MVINWIHYLYLNQDLIAEGITTKEQAIDHYNNIGKKEGRLYKYNIPKDFDKVFYSNLYPNLKGLPDDVLYAHYTIYGRKNKSPYNSKKLEPSKDNLEIFFSKDIDKNIFFFAPHTPEFDTSSGGYRLFQILTILKNLKYNVYYFCNSIISQKHLVALENLKIPVFITDIKQKKYTTDFAKKLYDEGIKPNYIFVAWRDMAKQVIPYIKNHFPKAKIIIDSVDIHWARERRYLDLKNQKESSEFLFNKNLEKSLYKSANVVLCVTDNDKAEILKEIPDADLNIKILSNIYPDSYVSTSSKTKKQDIIFIGGFNHSPNIDAALWAHEIYSKFIVASKLKQIPKLYIIGSNPPEEIVKLHNGKNIFVTGYVEDVEQKRRYFYQYL